MPSMRQLADLAGVAVSTVSKALRDDPTIPAVTRQRIKTLAEEHGYIPNQLGRAFMSGKSGILGCITHRFAGPFFARVLQGLLEQAPIAGYWVMVLQTGHDRESVSQAVRTLLEHRVEGIIFNLLLDELLPRKLLYEVYSAGVVPVTVSSSAFTMPIDWVTSQEDDIATLAVDYLWNMGHRNIAFVGDVHQPGKPRLDAMRKAFTHYGLGQQYFATVPMPKDSITAVKQLMLRPSPPTAIIAFSDNFAESQLYLLPSQGIRIPQDVSILGIGNLLGEMFSPVLTSIDLHPEEMGRQAVITVTDRIGSGQTSGAYAPTTWNISPSLIERVTCGPPHRG